MSVLDNKVVLVTGGTGTFGKAFLSRALQTAISKIIILSRDELKQSEMQADPKLQDAQDRARYFIGDVRDKDRLYRAFDGVDIVVHAAAMKQINAASYNPLEAVKTNVMGSANVIDAAIDRNVAKVIGISSDKACEATTLYGSTKACMEGLFRSAGAYSGKHKTRFCTARWGNVLRSRGSVVPFFEALLRRGLSLPITDYRATRFNLRIESAIGFVMECLEHMDGRFSGGETFIPKLKAYQITDVTTALGATEIRNVGLRPQEKLHEVMIGTEEIHSALDHGTFYSLNASGIFAASRPLSRYDSENAQRLTIEELRKEIEETR